MTRSVRSARNLRAHVAACGVMVLTGLIWALPGAAQAAPTPPQLSIAVDDGRASAAPKDTLSYQVTVTNLGTRPVKDLIITQTIPDGADLTSTDPEASKKSQTLTWEVDIKPGKTASIRSAVAVGATLPDGLLRLATVACARTSAKAAPLVCASDSNQLPAGAVADEQRRELEETAADVEGWWPLPGAMVLAGVVLAMVIAGLLVLRRRGRGQPPGGPNAEVNTPAGLVSSLRP